MAGVTGNGRASAEIAFVYRVDHRDHASRDAFSRNVVGKLLPVLQAFGDMTEDAVQAHRRRKKAHCAHELAHRNALQDLNIGEYLFRHRLFFDRRGLGRKR